MAAKAGPLLYLASGDGHFILPHAMKELRCTHIIIVDEKPVDFKQTELPTHGPCPTFLSYHTDSCNDRPARRSLVQELRRTLVRMGCTFREASFPAFFLHQLHTSGPFSARIDLFYSTPSLRTTHNSVLATLLPTVELLWVGGATPAHAVPTHDLLPAVRTVIASSRAYWAAITKSLHHAQQVECDPHPSPASCGADSHNGANGGNGHSDTTVDGFKLNEEELM